MKQTQTHAWSPAGEEAVAYSLARRNAAAVTLESGEVAAYFLARKRRRWQSPADAGQRENTETVAKQKQPPSAGLQCWTLRGEKMNFCILWALSWSYCMLFTHIS